MICIEIYFLFRTITLLANAVFSKGPILGVKILDAAAQFIFMLNGIVNRGKRSRRNETAF